jgi:hypothetical protein
MRFLPTLQQFMRRLLRRGPAEPQDPYARVRAPLRRGPSGRSAAVALEEPPEEKRVNAFGRWIPKAEL